MSVTPASVHPDYDLVDGPPTVDDYVRLRIESGLTPRTPEQAAPAIAASWAWFHVKHRGMGETVAMGRLLGDGGWYFVVADMATLPGHQRKGLGGAVLDALLQRVRTEAPPNAYVTLMADAAGRALYESRGFVETAPRSVGMRLER